MERYIDEAVKLYSGDKPIGLFVQKLEYNLIKMNEIFLEIKKVFEDAGVPNLERNPNDKPSCGQFALLFKQLNDHLEAAKIQGFRWEQMVYEFKEQGHKKTIVEMCFDENTYLILAQRYKELFVNIGGEGPIGDVPFEIDGYLTEIDTGRIDADYMNSRFDKYLKLVNIPETSKEIIEQALTDLHKTFATLTQEEQKYANIFLHDIQRGDVTAEKGKTLRDYITEYQVKAKEDQIYRISDIFGMDKNILREMMGIKLIDANINEYGRFDKLKATVDKAKAKIYLEQKQGVRLSPPKVTIEVDKLLRKFLLEGGFDVE
jgi:type I restriction enzyme R subunit